MRFKIRFASQIVGLFVIIAAVFLSGIFIFMGANQRWFSRNYEFFSRFNSGKGISAGMSISFKGFEIGKVTRVNLTEENKVEVGFYVQDTYYPKLYRDSVLQLTSSPIGLGGGMVFYQGKAASDLIPENSYVPSLDSDEGRELVRQGRVNIPKEDDAITNIVGGIAPIMANVNATLEQLNELLGSVNAAVKGKSQGPLGAIVKDAQGIVKDTQGIVTNIGTTTRSINNALPVAFSQVEELLTHLNAISANLQVTSEQLKDPKGIVPKLLDPKGSMATFLDDNNALFDRVDAILKTVNESIVEVREFAKFINTTRPQIIGVLEEGREAVSKGKDVLEGLKNNPLLKGGIPERVQQPTTFKSYRDEDF
jgi:phospholipid/cholesterol/gamma-HCH transport system substrate-binding protein